MIFLKKLELKVCLLCTSQFWPSALTADQRCAQNGGKPKKKKPEKNPKTRLLYTVVLSPWGCRHHIGRYSSIQVLASWIPTLLLCLNHILPAASCRQGGAWALSGCLFANAVPRFGKQSTPLQRPGNKTLYEQQRWSEILTAGSSLDPPTATLGLEMFPSWSGCRHSQNNQLLINSSISRKVVWGFPV